MISLEEAFITVHRTAGQSEATILKNDCRGICPLPNVKQPGKLSAPFLEEPTTVRHVNLICLTLILLTWRIG